MARNRKTLFVCFALYVFVCLVVFLLQKSQPLDKIDLSLGYEPILKTFHFLIDASLTYVRFVFLPAFVGSTFFSSHDSL